MPVSSCPMRGLVVILVLVVGLLLVPASAATRATPSAAVLAQPLPSYRIVVPGLTREVTRQVTLAAVGDVMLARTVGDRIVADGPDLAFAGVAHTLAAADLVSANLECALSQFRSSTAGLRAAAAFVPQGHASGEGVHLSRPSPPRLTRWLPGESAS